MYPLLVADIGGTKASYGLVYGRCSKTGEYQLTQQKTIPCSQHESLSASLHHYLNTAGVTPSYACIAIAGPVHGELLKMTNINWQFSRSEVIKEFTMKKLELINDFAAQAYAVPFLPETDLNTIKSGISHHDAPRVIIGPGTGLGVANLIRTSDGWLPLAGEGGHSNFAPGNELELEVLKLLWRSQRPISLENILSGPGLVMIYRALAEIGDIKAEDLRPEDITSRNDPLCRKALDLFCSVLGSAAGDMALISGAKGGVYITGGILPKIRGYLSESQFLSRFEDKGVISDYLRDIPVKLVTHENPALIGAAAWLDHRLK